MQTRLNRTQNKLIKTTRESGNTGGWKKKNRRAEEKIKMRKKNYQDNKLPHK